MNFLAIFNVIMALIGIYMVVSAVNMKHKGQVSSIIVSVEDMKRCNNKNGFIQFFYGKQLMFGIVSVILGIIGAIDGWMISSTFFKYIEMILFLAAFVYFEEMIKKARTLFFKES